MPALIDLRRRIRSVKNTKQITQAMKTVSTAKFQKAQKGVMEGRPLWHGFPELAAEIAGWAAGSPNPLLARRREKKIEVVIVTADKGLCGAFNSNLMEKVNNFLEKKAETCDVRLTLLGKKANAFFKKSDHPVGRAFTQEVAKFTDEDLKDLSEYIIRLYMLSRCDAVYLAYNEFKSILAPQILITKLLPIVGEGGNGTGPEKASGTFSGKKGEADLSEEKMLASPFLVPDWEPGREGMLARMLPRYIKAQIKHIFFESAAAEHAARMMAMDNASRNAEDLIGELTLVLNKIRQAEITKELLEIMTAVEALSKK